MLKSTVLSAVLSMKVALQDLAVDAQLVRRAPQTYVPGQSASTVDVRTDIKLVLTKYTTKEIDGERIQAGDYQGIVFQNEVPIDISTNDVIDDSTKIWRVVNEEKITVGSETAVFVLHLRKK